MPLYKMIRVESTLEEQGTGIGGFNVQSVPVILFMVEH